MNHLRVLNFLLLGLVGAFVLFFLLDFTGGLLLDAIGHLLAGWAIFLRRNLQSLIIEPDILVSGLTAAILAVLTLHLLARWFAKHFHLKWPLASTLSVFGFMIVLFAASFLVPGVLSISKLMLAEPWVDRSRGSEAYSIRRRLLNSTCYFSRPSLKRICRLLRQSTHFLKHHA